MARNSPIHPNAVKAPAISFITCVYNASKWLHRCLNSILSQTDSDFEAIIVNDGSTDNSQEIIDQYIQKSKKIKAFSQPNAGTAAATNLAISLCSGDYIVNVDNDDWIEKDLVKEVKAVIAKHHPDIISFRGIDNNGHQFPDNDRWLCNDPKVFRGMDDIWQGVIEKKINFFTHTTQAISRHYIVKYPFTPPASSADAIVMLQLFCDINSCFILPKNLYHYNNRHDSQSHTHPKNEPVINLSRLVSVLPIVNGLVPSCKRPVPMLKGIVRLIENAYIANSSLGDDALSYGVIRKKIRRYKHLFYFGKPPDLKDRFKFFIWLFFPRVMVFRSTHLIKKNK